MNTTSFPYSALDPLDIVVPSTVADTVYPSPSANITLCCVLFATTVNVTLSVTFTVYFPSFPAVNVVVPFATEIISCPVAGVTVNTTFVPYSTDAPAVTVPSTVYCPSTDEYVTVCFVNCASTINITSSSTVTLYVFPSFSGFTIVFLFFTVTSYPVAGVTVNTISSP